MALDYNEYPGPVITPDQAVRILLQDPSSTSGEWAVSPTVTIRQVAELVSYRQEEVFFTEDANVLWFNARHTYADLGFRKEHEKLEMRQMYGRLNGHIHVIGPQVAPNTFISWSDIWNISYYPNPLSRYVLFHRKGGLEYTRPDIEPGDMNSVLKDFSLEVGVDCISPRDHKLNVINVVDLDSSRHYDLAGTFARRHHMVVQEYEWPDTAGMQSLVDIVNLRESA